jgi:transcriptional regulator, merR
MEFGARFRQLRLQNRLTQSQVAEKLGIKQSNISDWENNISRPEYENLIALSKLYDETLESLLGLEEG